MPNKQTNHLIIKEKDRLRYRHIPTEEQAREICTGISLALKHIYPGYLWEVGMEQDMVHIRCLNLHGQYGYRMHLSEIDVDGRAVMRAGGEILERFNCNRKWARRSEVDSIQRDARGNGIHFT